MSHISTWIAASLVVATALAWVMSTAAVGAPDESAAVRAQNAAFVDAWNRHDAMALTALHTEDADSIAPWAEKLSGRAEIQRAFVDRHSSAGALRESTFTKTIDELRFPSTDVAVTDATAVVTGAYGPDGSKAGPTTFHVTEIWKKADGTWRIYACRVYAKPAEGGSAGTAAGTSQGDMVTVRYQVADVDRAIRFYTEHLGFRPEHKVGSMFASVSRDRLRLILGGPGSSGSRPLPDGRRQEPGGWNRIVLYVDDLAALASKLEKAGVRLRNQIEVGPGGSQVQVEDPDGNPIELHGAPRAGAGR